MALRLYNTLRRRKEEFRSPKDGPVGLYSCGPTVYDVAHIGNMRAFVTYDLARRTLEHKGWSVRHVMNVTDVDDRIIGALAGGKVSRREYTAKYEEAYFADLDRMGILRAHVNPRATEHIDRMVELIVRLEENGLTYRAEGSVYFSVSRFADYGKLSGMGMEELRSSGRVDSDHYQKEEARDFALWKGWTEADGDVVWEAPFGRGRPGWHIECSAMSMAYLGETFDLHCGGVDLVFPHHENEIAQSEGATGKPFVRTWVHNEFLLVEGEKMSKSLGNFVVPADVFERGYEGRHLRYSFFQTHYRQPFNFTWKGMDQAAAAIRGLDDFRLRIGEAAEEGRSGALTPVIERAERDFEAALEDDLNTPQALAAVHTLAREASRVGFGRGDRPRLEGFLSRVDAVLGVLGGPAEDLLTPEEADLVAQREGARARKDYTESDRLRDLLRAKGLEVRDTSGGTTWRRIGRDP